MGAITVKRASVDVKTRQQPRGKSAKIKPKTSMSRVWPTVQMAISSVSGRVRVIMMN